MGAVPKRRISKARRDRRRAHDSIRTFHLVRCENCGTITRLRADKEYDLIREDDGFVWHKTIVDSRCFRPIPTVVYLDSNYQMTSAEMTGGVFVSEQEYNVSLEPDTSKVLGKGEDISDQDAESN